MPYTLRSQDLANMTQEEKDAAVERLFNPTEEDVEAAKRMINARLRKFEQRYEMSTERMRKRMREGELRETAEIAEWLFWAEVRDAEQEATSKR